MPLCCVPQCNNTEQNKPEGIQFFRFPVDERECKRWLKLIRREDFAWQIETRICSWHFPEGKRKGPTRFAWNVKKNFILTGVSTVSGRNKRKCKDLVLEANDGDNYEIGHISSEEYGIAVSKINTLESELKISKSQCKEHELSIKRSNTQLLELSVELDQKNYEIRKLQCKLNLSGHFEEELKQNKLLLDSLKSEFPKTTTTHSNLMPGFANDFVKWDDDTLSSFIGFRHHSSFNLLTEMLSHKGISGQKSKKITCLSASEQVLLFLVKLRLDLPNLVLAKLFKVSIFTVSNVFNSVLAFVYELFYEGCGPLTKIPSRGKTSISLPKCFSDMMNCRIVIDCTEFTIEAPSKMKDKKVTYSNYKSRYTMKALIGCAPNGTAVFVSDLHGGSESDKSIVISSKLLEKMEPGDLMLADKGFELHDILPPGVSLNIPSFLINKQFTLHETLRNRSYARARIIIERLNAKFKIFKILDCIRSGDRSKADRLVKVCVALTTLMPSLMDELNDIE